MRTIGDYSIWILEYASAPKQPAEAAFSGYAHLNETMYFAFSFILVQGEGRNILIDCGINFDSVVKQNLATGFNVENWHSPAEVLAEVGLTPEDIDVIIPTHAHWDHMGSLELFPNAHVYLQLEELEGWSQLLEGSDQYLALLSAVDAADISYVQALQSSGRLHLLDGEQDNLFPGIHIWVDYNGHCHASQLISIESQTDKYIAIGDIAYTMGNLIGVPEFPHFIPNTKWAIGGAYSTMKMYERILDYSEGHLERILIEHDEGTWNRHPTKLYLNGLHLSEVRLRKNKASLLK